MSCAHHSTVEIWHIPTIPDTSIIDHLKSMLSADEQLRAQQMRIAAQRNTYITSHVAVREIIAKHLDIPAHAVELLIDEHGKPYIQGSKPLFFNLSHTGQYALLGLSRHCAIGIDIETIDQQRNCLAIAKRFFSTNEYDWLRRKNPEALMTRFHQLWCHKEAYLKAKGTGLRGGLSSFTLSEKDLFDTININDDDNHAWYLSSIDVPSLYQAALAVDCSNSRIDIRYWQAPEHG